MTITKDELHKLIDNLDIEKLKSYEITLRLALERCQMPTQYENMKNLFNKLKLVGFEYDGFDNQYAKKFTTVHCNENIKKTIIVIVYKTQIHITTDKEQKIIVDNPYNHGKVFEAIDFLTQWQS